MQTLRIHALTPLLFRDARPFSAGAGESRATSLLLPPPSAVAGLVRSFVGAQLGWDWRDPAVVETARGIRIAGQHLERHRAGQVKAVVPAPLTAVPHGDPNIDGPSMMRLAPAEATGGAEEPGTDTPAGIGPVAVTADVKRLPGYRLWTWSDARDWLTGADVVPEPVDQPPAEERVQITVDPHRQAADDGMLFTVAYRAWDDGDNGDGGEHTTWSLVVSVDGLDSRLAGDVAHFGGERRPVTITTEEPAPLQPGPALRAALTGSRQVTFQLLTPGLFTHGWRPGWSDHPELVHQALTGAVLRSAAVGRPDTVSGWSYEQGRRGPKATRWAAPAGSTYFVDLARPLTERDLDELWLSSVCDHDQDRLDGYGVAVWGVWNR